MASIFSPLTRRINTPTDSAASFEFTCPVSTVVMSQTNTKGDAARRQAALKVEASVQAAASETKGQNAPAAASDETAPARCLRGNREATYQRMREDAEHTPEDPDYDSDEDPDFDENYSDHDNDEEPDDDDDDNDGEEEG